MPPTPGAGITVVLFSYFTVRNLLIVTGARDTIVAWLPLCPALHCQAAALSLLISLILCGISPTAPNTQECSSFKILLSQQPTLTFKKGKIVKLL